MILTQHGMNSINRDNQEYVQIGGKDYRVIAMPDGKIWLGENLDYAWNGLSVGEEGSSTSVARANYYDNNESTYGWNGRKTGLLYNGVAVEYLINNQSLLNGFHVATKAEFESLITAVGGSLAGSKVKAKNLDYAPSWGGTDDYRLSIVPSGYYNGSFGNGTVETHFWTSTHGSISTLYILDIGASGDMSIGWNYLNRQYVVRLVKD